MNFRTASILILIMAVSSGCSHVAETETYAARTEREVNEVLADMGVIKGEPASQLFNFTINGFNPINEKSLVITAGVNDRYLVTLQGICLDLDFAFGIAFDTGNRSYLSRMDNLLVRDMNYNNRRAVRCPIEQIYNLENATPPASASVANSV